MPPAWTVSTTGQAPAWPDGLRTTSSASSRTKSTFCSASSPSTSGPSPVAASRSASESQSATSSGEPTTRTPLPSYPPLGILTTTGQPTLSPESCNEAASLTCAQLGQAIPMSVSRRRMASLSWANTRAAGEGCRMTPSACRAARTSAGTCSWSKVTTSHCLAKARTASISVWSPTGDDGMTRAADASTDSARTDSVIDKPTAGGWHIRASWPPPMMPTTGNPPGARCGAVTNMSLSGRDVNGGRYGRLGSYCDDKWTWVDQSCPGGADRPRPRNAQVRRGWRGGVRHRPGHLQHPGVRPTPAGDVQPAEHRRCATRQATDGSRHRCDRVHAGGLGRQQAVDLPPSSQPATQPRTRPVPALERRGHDHLSDLPGHIPLRLRPAHPARRQRDQYHWDSTWDAVPFLVLPQVRVRWHAGRRSYGVRPGSRRAGSHRQRLAGIRLGEEQRKNRRLPLDQLKATTVGLSQVTSQSQPQTGTVRGADRAFEYVRRNRCRHTLTLVADLHHH